MLVALGAGAWWLAANTVRNLIAQNKTTGFDFLWRTAGFDVSFSLNGFGGGSFYWEALVSGLLSTILAAAISIVLATLIGFIFGIARLSNNWVIARLATVYIEVVRNVPLLLQLFVWYFAVLGALPNVRNSLVWFESIVLNQRNLYIPKMLGDDRLIWSWVAVVLAILVALGIRFWAKRRLEQTGRQFPVFLTSLAVIVVLPALVFLLSGTQLQWEIPELQGFNYRGGVIVPRELVALVIGLSMYHGAFIAETVRGGIRAINHGQTEAAQSLGLKDGARLRLVIIPQAMRIIIPPLTSQYLNVIKNSSLGAAIAYPEFVSVFMGTTLNQTGRAIEIVGITMLVYLTLSLSTSAFMNWYNARIALVER